MSLAAKLARREMRSGLGGFRLFLACLALGVGAIAAILSFSRAIEEGLRADARELLGGDVAISLLYRQATPDQLAFLREQGEVVRWVDSRSMARPARPGGSAALVQLKAVEPGYPLYGRVELRGSGSLSETLARRDGVWGAAVEEAALKRMNIALGDLVKVGETTLQVRAVIEREPDSGLSAFASLGPRLMMPWAALGESGLVQPGSLLTWQYRLKLPPGRSDREVAAAIKARFPEAGWRVRDLGDAGGGLRFWLDRLTEFISLVGLAALLVGGVGVGNAVSSFLAGRMRTIAIMKCLGAPQRLVFATYFLQLGALALAGVFAGVALGAALPFLAQPLIADLLPVKARIAFYLRPLATAAAFGLLVSALFALLPLIHARAIPAAALMRGIGIERRRLVWHELALVGAVTLLLAGFTILTSDSGRIAGYFVLGAIGAFIAFPALARGVMAVAARVGKPRLAGLRLALANLHRPGSATPIVMLSLGLGLTVLVATALIEGNLRDQITQRIPKDAPAFFFVDIQSSQMPDFERAVAAIPGAGALEKVPSLRGRIVKLAGKPVSAVKIPSGARWAVDGDRGITYAARPPEGAHIVAGSWWAPDYRGPQLVSFDETLAHDFGLAIGDTVTVNVLGREIEARIASLRHIDWQTLAINFVMVFSPGVLDRAPHTFLATVKATPEAEDAIFKTVTDKFPNVTVVSVRDAVQTASEVLGNIGLATQLIGLLSILAGILVLAGAMLATQRRRIHEAVVMKVLGATRARIAAIFAWEFLALGLATALAALGVGTLAAYLVVRQLMSLQWSFQPVVAVAVALGAMALTLAFGLAGTLAALRQRPLALLRNE
ncbi:FtsX-like permease family protein [Enhydrobacter sp.]|jgi:putative ABC transport system permease protein|uniref:ABC transporter permease n=1 Tax=Enhydrobacter sp. TaxID=1894999 RepID=UPI002619FA82|nr:FtsX-like permease family protein [Enhydrobacter sp.]WIM11710.1 MAG: ABC transporter, fused permease protein [Enhydrobacter sp.]